ncbi:hypothetical protein [Paramicrobacterium agarici]|uniref:DUF559 domain-containing protein n=1 Tax=Paramicrobacterium agarici TaxID=630514 RepID=A0A2A9DVA6_9MICO|nr:hypothetical protein [Microbacterium agarici]PFG30717.1 hypothetical protein ATJ78_1653 [Microbacterium agarici]
MGRPISPLPASLGEVFTVAEALEAGVPRWRLDADDLEAPFWGVRRRTASTEPLEGTRSQALIARMHDLAPALPSYAFFSHAPAAAAWGLPLPLREYDVLDVSVADPHRTVRRRGVRPHRVKPELVQVVEHRGLRITDPASTWVQLATRLSLYDLVAAGDAVVRVKESAGPYDHSTPTPPLTTVDALADAISRRHPRAALLRQALPLLRTNSWSRPEPHLRLLLVDGGLPEPVLNYNIVDEIGRWVKCVDLAYPQWRIAIEYQSAYHREAAQYSRDVSALAELARLGWYTVQLTSTHVFAYPNLAASTVGEAILAQQKRPLHAPTRPELPA